MQIAPKQTAAKFPLPVVDNSVLCDICRKRFQLSRNNLKEETVTLEKGGQTHEVRLTYLYCPHCGKHYPVIMDDEKTLPILNSLKEMMIRRIKFKSRGKSVPEKLEQKYNRLNQKLDFKRQELAEKFNGSFYQTEEGKERLEYRYHAR
jgi:uncharacterized protein YbaR (Trm112 family)